MVIPDFLCQSGHGSWSLFDALAELSFCWWWTQGRWSRRPPRGYSPILDAGYVAGILVHSVCLFQADSEPNVCACWSKEVYASPKGLIQTNWPSSLFLWHSQFDSVWRTVAMHCFLCISVFVFKIWVSKILMSHNFAMFYNVNVSKTKISPFYTVLCPIWQSSLPSLTELSSLFDRFNSPIFSGLSPLFYIVISPIWQICRSYFLTEFSPLFNRVLSPIWQSALPYFIQSFLSYLTDLQR